MAKKDEKVRVLAIRPTRVGHEPLAVGQQMTVSKADADILIGAKKAVPATKENLEEYKGVIEAAKKAAVKKTAE